MQISHAKINAYGETGGGKTTLLAMLLIYLSKQYHGGAPVAMMSTEPGVDYVIPIFEAEGVPLMLHRSKSFGDLIMVAKEAVATKCCAMGVDSMTHVWTELCDSYQKKMKVNKLEFQHWKAIKGTDGGWADWTEFFINSRLHMVTSGRAGFEYEYEDKQDGTRELIKGDSKMKAEGEFGYEADLLVELSRTTDKAEMRRAKKEQGKRPGQPTGGISLVRHHALIKKCRVWELNDKQFAWHSQGNYEKGYYETVGRAFGPYFEFLAANRAKLNGNSSATIVDTSRHTQHATPETNGDYYKKKAALDQWGATMAMLFPSANSTSHKHARQVVGEAITNVRGAVAFRALHIDALKYYVDILRQFEDQAKREKVISALPDQTDTALVALVAMAREVVDSQAKKPPTENEQSIESLFDNEQEQVF